MRKHSKVSVRARIAGTRKTEDRKEHAMKRAVLAFLVLFLFATMALALTYGMPLTLGDQVYMLLMLMVTSKGMAGVPRASCDDE
jgi:small neutral amino acid transporter SnatA (MarC family)